MGVVFTQESMYAKEMRNWESTHTQFGAPGRPYVFREFPKRLYQAGRVAGRIQIIDAQTAKNEHEEANLQSRGFYFGQDAAIAAIDREQTEHGKLAAEREYAIQHSRLSPKAVEEVRTAEAAHGAQHLPDVPATPVPAHQKRGKDSA